jgi:hypothetical protein
MILNSTPCHYIEVEINDVTLKQKNFFVIYMRKRPAAPYRLAKITSGPFHLVYKEKSQRHPTAWQKLRADPSTSHIKEKKATSYKKKAATRYW